MRKIERDMVSAINGGYDWRSSNTTVTFDGDDWEVRLHGNLIARYVGGKLEVSVAGWNTHTTRSRVNAILRHFKYRTNLDHLKQKNFELVAVYQDGTEEQIDNLEVFL